MWSTSTRTPSKFANRFYGALDWYAVQTENIDTSIDRQFVVLMVDNAKLSEEICSSLIFNLTTESIATFSEPVTTVTTEIIKLII